MFDFIGRVREESAKICGGGVHRMRKDARVWINSGYDGGRSTFGAGHLSVLE